MGFDNPDQLLHYRTFKQCFKFYKQEYKIITDMIREYHAYLMYGFHFFSCLVGDEREEKDMYDYRIRSSKITYSNSKDN